MFLLPFEEIVRRICMDQAARVALQFGGAALDSLQNVSCFRPVSFRKERNFARLKRASEFRIGRQRFLQCDPLGVLRLAHLDYAARFLRLGETAGAIDRVVFGLTNIRALNSRNALSYMRSTPLWWAHVCRREGTKNQDRESSRISDVQQNR